jgi:membrane-associated protease RseP (regulator of RpoE activity)
VRDGEVASVQLTAPALRKQIRGVVRAGGEPVPDLYVVAAREDSPHARLALTSPDAPAKPVLTASDGTFTLDRLAEGTYVVRAYRRGGGEAQAEHVATGADIVLELAPTASIAGTVRGNGSVDSVTVQLTTELQTLRYESFHRTGGRFVIRDIPPGSYNLEIEAAAGRLRRAITLAPGEEQRLDLELQPLVAIVGRLVDVRSGEPVPGANVTIGYQDAVVADAAGQFRIERISPGPVQLSWRQEGVGQTVPRIVDNRGSTFDLGDVAIALPRSAYNASGNLGFELDENGVRVAAVTAASSLEVGDVIVAIDGIDVSGDRSVHALNLLTAPPGTSLALRLARGPTVAIIAGPRREFD